MPSALAHADAVARAWVVGHRLPAFDGLMWLLSAIGRGGFVFIAIGAALSITRRRWRELAQVGLAVLVTGLVIDHVLKPAVGRERPFARMPAVAVIGGRPDGASFPSGHAGNAFAGATVLWRAAPGGAPFWCALAVTVAYSRVYLGVHYPGDVVGGAIIGAVIGAAVSAMLSAPRPR